MTFIEILVEGSSDAPTVREVLSRHFGLTESDFRVIRHRGKGTLPANPLARPEPRHRGLLDQLPAKLRGYAQLPVGYAIVVLVDADADDCRRLKADLMAMYSSLPSRPPIVLFRIAVEETESWFLAQPDAVEAAYPRANTRLLRQVEPDAVVGAWETLARSLGRRPRDCSGADKQEWAEEISPHLDFDRPVSPSLATFVSGIAGLLPSRAG